MPRAISAIDVNTTILHYDETINGVTTTCAYWPLKKDANGNVKKVLKK